MLVLLISGLALAQDAATTPAFETALPAIVSDRKGGAKGKGKGKRGKRKKEEWRSRFYARPMVAGSSFTGPDGETQTALGIGGEGGIRYWEVNKAFPRLRGRTRGTIEYIMSLGTTGMAVKAGSFMGPAWKNFALESGLDLSWDRYEWGDVTMEPTIGAGIPVIASAGIKGISVYAGLQPTWVNNEDREVDWSETDEFGFGDEFSTFLGGSIAIDDMSLTIGYTRRVTVFGVQQGYGVSANIRG
jgi:hypothetical protein